MNTRTTMSNIKEYESDPWFQSLLKYYQHWCGFELDNKNLPKDSPKVQIFYVDF